MSRLGLLLLVAALAACSGGGSGGNDNVAGGGGGQGGGGAPPPAPPPPAGIVTGGPTVPQGATPPVGVTLHVGIPENVARSQMEALFASFVAASNALWNVSEGQVRIDKVKIFDAVAPGVTATQFTFNPGAIDTSNLDVVAFTPPSWDIPGAGGAVAVQPGMGRNGRLMIIPTNAQTFVTLHECSHLVFQLTWNAGPLLTDEYADGVQDQACVMESMNPPTRWCSAGNHTNQSSQPRSCWGQILRDYARFRHNGTEIAPTLPQAPTAEYNDS